MKKEVSIYIHFPYCRSRCPYCDFFRALKPKEFDETLLVERYLTDLERFLPYISGRAVKSVFFGGGTPSLLSPQAIGLVLDGISKRCDMLPNAEVSLEANPNTFEREKFLEFRAVGINRLSLGVQALNVADLKFLGRTHSLADASQAMELGAEVFPKFSIDLIYSRPNQRWDEWQKEIDLALSYGLQHISLYQLTIEDGTIFARKNVRGLEEEKSASLYEQTVSYLRSQGLERYEVSNFAKIGQESCHNMVYWQGGDYIGLGEGAHGRLGTNGKIYATVDGQLAEVLTPEERAEELVLMGLRIKEGLNAETFYQACGVRLFDFLNPQALRALMGQGLITYDERGVRLTDAGFLLLDEIVCQLVS
ncbi:MAG: radical SAM family heme chaperone HemW [Acetobacter sp.]|nr:radical SAM family heme chaperone HemW [Acetobacter sp.]